MTEVVNVNCPSDLFDLTQEQAVSINAILPMHEYVVGIRKNETGEVRFCPEDLEWYEHSIYWWSEGNMGCDCNRELEFLRAGNEETDDSFENAECSQGRYTVVGIWFKDGSDIRDLYSLNDV